MKTEQKRAITYHGLPYFNGKFTIGNEYNIFGFCDAGFDIVNDDGETEEWDYEGIIKNFFIR